MSDGSVSVIVIDSNRIVIKTRLQWSSYSKWHLGYQMITFLMTSRDPRRSRSCLRYMDANTSKIVSGKGLVPEDSQQEMAYGECESNDHVIEIQDGGLVVLF